MSQTGQLIINKTSEDGVLEGFEFIVSGTDFLGNSFEKIYVTDAEGKVEIEMRPGSYTVSEKDDPNNIRYVLPADQTVEIKANEELVAEFENIIKTGSIEFKKVDKSTGKPLEGVLFKVFDADGNQIAECRTNADGIARFDGMKYGKYYWQEAEAPAGYMPENSMHEFAITEHGQLISVTVENEPVPKTGDESNLPFWCSIMALSFVGSVGTVFAKKRRKSVEV